MPDLGELLISIRINSSAALDSLRTMKQELNEVKQNANSMQQALDNTAKSSSKSAQGFESINNATASMNEGIKKSITRIDTFDKAVDSVFKKYKGKPITLGDIIKEQDKLLKMTAAHNEELDKTPKKFDNITASIKNNTSAYRTLAMYATAVFAGITVAVKKGTDAFNQYRSAMTGLKSIAQGTGNSFGQAQKFIEEYTKDGLIPASEAATALKNLLSRGYTDTQAIDVLNRLKDSAAFGRQASLGLGEAVRSASEGLKNENSILVDNAGVTKNVSKMWEDYAKQIGKTVNDLSQAEKIQAEYNGIMAETKHQVGDAAKLSGELAGTQAAVGKSVNELGVAFGESLAPALNTFLSLLNGLIKSLTNFVENNKTLVSTLTIVGVVLTGLIAILTGGAAAIGMISSALGALNISLGALMLNPVTIGFGALAVAIGLVIAATSKANQKAIEHNKTLEEEAAILKKLKQLKEEGITLDKKDIYQNEATKAKFYLKEYDELKQKMTDLSFWVYSFDKKEIRLMSEDQKMKLQEAEQELAKLGKQLDEVIKNAGDDGINLSTKQAVENTRALTKEEEKQLDIVKALDTETSKTRIKEISNTQSSIQTVKNLIETYKSAEKGTSDWIEAEKELAELYPEFSTLSGIKINAIEDEITAKEKQNKTDWAVFKQESKINVERLKAIKTEQEAIGSLINIKALEAQIRYGDTGAYERIREALKAQQNLKDIEEAIKYYEQIANMNINEVPGQKPIRKDSAISSGKAEKTAYEKAIELYQHRKNLGQLTLTDEVKVLSDIKKLHAKSAEEIMDADERIYDARIALQDSILKLSEDELKYKDSNSNRWIAQKKRENELTLQEEIEAYGRIKARHTEYLAKILADENVTAEKKAEIHDRELNEIDSIEETIYGLRKDYLKKFEEDNKDTVDTLLSDWERYIKRQKLRNKMDADEEVKNYQGMIQANKDYIKKIESDTTLSEAEKLDMLKEKAREIEDLEDKIYSTKKDMLDKYLDEYYSSLEDEVDAQEDAELDKLKAKKEAIEKYYDDLAKQSDKEDRSEKLAELRKKEFLYQNAATKEGLETLADIRQEIADLEAEAEEERLEAEKEAKLNALDAEIEATETKYETMRKNLETLRKDMETETYKMAESIGINLNNAQQAIADKTVGIFRDADSSISSFLSNMRDKIRQAEGMQIQLSSGTANSVSNIIDTTQRTTGSLQSVGNLVSTALKEGFSILKQQRPVSPNITFNDYGNKTLGNKDDYRDYAEEWLEAAKSKTGI